MVCQARGKQEYPSLQTASNSSSKAQALLLLKAGTLRAHGLLLQS